MVKLLNPEIEIGKIPMEKFASLNYLNNKESLTFVDGSEGDIKQSKIYKTILQIIQDDKIIKCYKIMLARLIPYKRLFREIAHQMSQENKFFFVVPSGDVFPGLNNSALDLELPIPKKNLILKMNRIRWGVIKAFYIVMHGFIPLGFLVPRLRRITFSNIRKEPYDVRMPVVWGFDNGDVNIDGVRKIDDDSYLYHKDLPPGRILHVFGKSDFPPYYEKKYQKRMKSLGFPFVMEVDFKMTPDFLYKWIIIYGKILFLMVRNFFYINENIKTIGLSNRILFYIYRKYLEMENIDYLVEYIVRDYSPYGVVSTILLNQQGRETVATQHTGSQFDLPYLSYIHFHRYIVYGDFYVKFFYPYWKNVNLAKTGRMNIDWVVNIINSPERKSSLIDRYEKLYPKRKFTALINFITTPPFLMKNRWEELLLGLQGLRDLDVDFNLFLRFRSKESMEFDHIKLFKNLPKFDERIIIDHEHFNTHELMALSDLFIGQSGSFGINEVVAAGKTVFAFDFTGQADFYYPDYGKDFILRTRGDIWKVFKGLESGFASFDCQWDRLKKDSNYYDDGRNLERIQNVVMEMVSEVKNKNNFASANKSKTVLATES